MKRFLVGLSLCLCFLTTLFAQTNSVIKELESKRAALQKQIRESESLVRSARNDVTSQLNSLNTITGQITERKRYIEYINNDMETINRQLNLIERDLVRLEESLLDRKKKYEASIQYLYKNRTVEEKLLFVFSAKTLTQTYRRLRYVNEYATYQRLQGEEILVKQEEVKKKRAELQDTKKAKEELLKEREEERKRLETEEQVKKNLLTALQKKQKTLQGELDKKRREANKLNARIDKLIADEIEKSRKAAEAEARRTGKPVDTKSASSKAFTLSKADRELSGSFANNRGKLPVPVTGAYMVVNGYGQYNVQGLRNVKLDNKGIDIQARPGAQARAIFDGEVTAVFEVSGLTNILVRHGNYISVYCNLSSASVKKGTKVKTGDSLGTIFSDKTDNNRTILHFQLRKEREQLNPEPWLNK
ncbi:peptidase M23 [Bacteroides sp. 51]|nr:peptidoglycan DD-metalloendopeptidase family protein [Bacteroides sp. 51]NDV84712.1 peptidase M23 [Bacteroides sp. 51]